MKLNGNFCENNINYIDFIPSMSWIYKTCIITKHNIEKNCCKFDTGIKIFYQNERWKKFIINEKIKFVNTINEFQECMKIFRSLARRVWIFLHWMDLSEAFRKECCTFFWKQKRSKLSKQSSNHFHITLNNKKSQMIIKSESIDKWKFDPSWEFWT